MSDQIGRSLAAVWSRRPEAPGSVLIVDNRGGLLSGADRFTYRVGVELYLLTGNALRRLELSKRTGYKGFFHVLGSLGTVPFALTSSANSAVTSLSDLRQLIGVAKIPNIIDALKFDLKQLAVPLTLAQVAPRLKLQQLSPPWHLTYDHVDFAMVNPDALAPQQRAAHLFASRLSPIARVPGLAELEPYTGDLPVDEEFVLAVDKTWSEQEVRRVRDFLDSARDDVTREIRSRYPTVAQTLLSAQGMHQHFAAFTHKTEIAVVREDFIGCAGGALSCRPTLEASLVTKLSTRFVPTGGGLAMCLPDRPNVLTNSPAVNNAGSGILPWPKDFCKYASGETLPTPAPPQVPKSWMERVVDMVAALGSIFMGSAPSSISEPLREDKRIMEELEADDRAKRQPPQKVP